MLRLHLTLVALMGGFQLALNRTNKIGDTKYNYLMYHTVQGA